MSDVYINKTTSATARQLIMEMHRNDLSAADLLALDSCLGPTSDIWVGYVDGRPVCAWGLVPPTMLSDRAYLWLYASEAVDDYKFLFVRYSQRIVDGLREYFPVIHGVCRTDNTRAQRWLKWLGAEFSLGDANHIPFEIRGHNG